MSDSQTILIVDDDDRFLEEAQRSLEADGYRVETARCRRDAEARLERARPAAAVLDLVLEEPDAGLVLAHHIKRAHPGVPVVLLDPEPVETGLAGAAGTRRWLPADAVLAKPVRLTQVRRELRRLVRT